MMLARRHPEIVASLINVEGNFTLEDAFWTAKLAAMTLSDVDTLLRGYQANASAWLTSAGIQPTAERVAAASRGLRAQRASTVKSMAQAVVETTSSFDYLRDVEAVLDSGIPIHLFAGERSRAGWHVPEFVLRRAASLTIQRATGHMMMLEAPHEFLRLIAKVIE